MVRQTGSGFRFFHASLAAAQFLEGNFISEK
jgi:hypothetical protein